MKIKVSYTLLRVIFNRISGLMNVSDVLNVLNVLGRGEGGGHGNFLRIPRENGQILILKNYF